MKSSNQAGFVSGTLVGLIAVSVVLVVVLIFGGWAFASRQDYKNNSDQKAEAAADQRQKETEAVEAQKYAEEAKNPLKSHKAPDQYGGVTVTFPKTWSGYVKENGSGNAPVDDYFHPAVVPDTSTRANAYALRIQIVDEPYDSVLKSYESEVKSNKLMTAPYALAKVPDAVGTKLDGEVESGKQGSLVVLPVRNMTLKIWTESPNYLADFNNIILPNLVFSP